MKFKLTTILTFFVLAISALANEPLRHEEVFIIAEPIAADEIDTEFQTGHVTVISSEQFQADVSTVADVIRKETGIQIRQSSGIGSYSSISIRGSTGAQVNVFLDGVLVNDAQGGVVDLSQFLLSGVESIEIYRGNVPIQLGESSIGGAINIKTKDASKAQRKQISLGYGSFNTKKASATLLGGDDITRYIGAVEYISSDNDYKLLNESQTSNNSLDDSIERRKNDEFKQLSVFGTLNHKISENLNISSIAQYSYKDNNIPTSSNTSDNNANFQTNNANIKFKLEQSLNNDSAITYLIYGGQKSTRYDDTDDKIGLSPNLEETKTNTLGFKTNLSQGMNSHLINIGAQIRYEQYQFDDLLKNISQEVSRTETSLSIQDEWLSPSGKLMLSGRAGLRNFVDSFDSEDQERDIRHYVDSHIGLRYELNDSYILRANISRDIRVPGLGELYGDNGSTVGNVDLKEEQALNADLGLSSHFSNFDLTGTFFYRQLSDAIVLIYDARSIGRAENISEAIVFGFELESSIALSNWFNSALKVTLQDSEDQSDIPSSKGNPLPGQYQNKASLINTIRAREVEMMVEFEHRSVGYYDSAATASLQTSNQFHFSLFRQFTSHRIELQIKNLLDERIEDFNRFPGPGRKIFLTYLYTF